MFTFELSRVNFRPGVGWSNTKTRMSFIKKEIAREAENSNDLVAEELLARPRKVEQPRNLKKKVNWQKRLRWDELYNVPEMALDMENFVHFITTFPDLLIICGLKQILGFRRHVTGPTFKQQCHIHHG